MLLPSDSSIFLLVLFRVAVLHRSHRLLCDSQWESSFRNRGTYVDFPGETIQGKSRRAGRYVVGIQPGEMSLTDKVILA